MPTAAPPIDGAAHLHSGKVRDLYLLDSGALLMVASDRISAYDFVLDTTIPDKGEILTRMSLWWFEQLADLVPHHVLSTDVPEPVRGRAVICERLDMYPIEFTGAARAQTRAVVRRVEELAARHPEAAAYAPGAIL